MCWATSQRSRWPAGMLVATAGCVRVNIVKDALKTSGDNLVVGRAITALNDVGHAADELLEQLDREEIGQSGDMTDLQSPAPAFQLNVVGIAYTSSIAE